jgi:hypothetical protein
MSYYVINKVKLFIFLANAVAKRNEKLLMGEEVRRESSKYSRTFLKSISPRSSLITRSIIYSSDCENHFRKNEFLRERELIKCLQFFKAFEPLYQAVGKVQSVVSLLTSRVYISRLEKRPRMKSKRKINQRALLRI